MQSDLQKFYLLFRRRGLFPAAAHIGAMCAARAKQLGNEPQIESAVIFFRAGDISKLAWLKDEIRHGFLLPENARQ